MAPSEKKRNAYGAEAALGIGAAGVIGSNRVPEMVNALAVRRREADAKAKEKKYGKVGDVVEGRQTYKPGTHGLTEEGKKVRLKKLPESTPGGELKPVLDESGNQRVNAKGEPIFNKTKPSKPREEATRRAVERKSAPARANVGNKANLPFPTSNWNYEPVGTEYPKQKPGKHAKGTQTPGRHARPAGEPTGAKKLALKAKNLVSPPPEVSDSGKMQRQRWTYNEKGKRVPTPAHLGQMRRARVMRIGLPVATAVAAHGTYGALKQQRLLEQKKVSKKANERDAIAGTVGGAAGLAAYQTPSYIEYQMRGDADKKANKSTKAQAALASWKKKYNIEAGTPRGIPTWDKAYRKYPKAMPDWKARRAWAYTHTGGTGRAAFVGATALGAAGAVAADRKFLRKKKP